MDYAKVVDSWMGSGKSTNVIEMIKEHPDKRYLIFVELLAEGERYKTECDNVEFFEPTDTEAWWQTKSGDFETLIKAGKNIIATHALAERLNLSGKTLEIMKEYKYTVIIDEAMEIVHAINMDEDDIHDLFTTEHIIVDDNKNVKWIDDKYKGDRVFLRGLARSNSLYLVEKDQGIKTDKDYLMWIMSPHIFEAADEMYILTFNFQDSYMRYYFDMFGIKYRMMHVEDGKFVDGLEDRTSIKRNAMHLLDIVDHKINDIGSTKTALSKGWYTKNAPKRDVVYKNAYNYLKNICKSTVQEAAYSIFKEYKNPDQLKRYENGFIAMNCRGTNRFGNKTNFAILVNIYMHPSIRNFFMKHGCGEIDEDGFALNQLMQLIWRSAIRNGKPVNLYLPSSRMRTLLTDYLSA